MGVRGSRRSVPSRGPLRGLCHDGAASSGARRSFQDAPSWSAAQKRGIPGLAEFDTPSAILIVWMVATSKTRAPPPTARGRAKRLQTGPPRLGWIAWIDRLKTQNAASGASVPSTSRLDQIAPDRIAISPPLTPQKPSISRAGGGAYISSPRVEAALEASARDIQLVCHFPIARE